MTTKEMKQMGRVSSKSRENVFYPRYVERDYRRSVIRNQLTYHLFCELLLSKCSNIHFVKYSLNFVSFPLVLQITVSRFKQMKIF